MNIFKIYKYVGVLGLVLLCLTTSAQKRKKNKKQADTISTIEIDYSAKSTIDSLIDFALPYQNTPYRYAGKQPGGFDCSGFMYYVFKSVGIKMPASSREIRTVGEEITKEKIKIGDVVYFTGRNAKSNVPGHVGMVIKVDANDEIWFIHASVQKGVCVDAVSQAYYAKRFLGARRILEE